MNSISRGCKGIADRCYIRLLSCVFVSNSFFCSILNDYTRITEYRQVPEFKCPFITALRFGPIRFIVGQDPIICIVAITVLIKLHSDTLRPLILMTGVLPALSANIRSSRIILGGWRVCNRHSLFNFHITIRDKAVAVFIDFPNNISNLCSIGVILGQSFPRSSSCSRLKLLNFSSVNSIYLVLCLLSFS